MFKHPVLLREVVTQHITDQGTINSCRSSKHFTLGQVAPFALLMIASMARNPLPVLMECCSNIAPLSRSDMNSASTAHKIIDVIGEFEYLIIIGTHAISHYRFVNTYHMPMTNLEFLHQEGKQGNTESNLAWLSSSNIESDSGPSLDQVLAQVIRKGGERSLTVVFEETHADISMQFHDDV